MDKINILYLHETSAIAGAENSLINLVMHQDRSRFLPVFVLPGEGPLAQELRKIGVEVIFTEFPQVRRCAGVAGAVKRLLKTVTEKNIRIVHSNSIRTHAYAAIVGKIKSLKVVWHERNLITKEIVDPDRLFSFFADALICNSYAIAARFLKKGILPRKIKVVYNGVDTARFNPGLDKEKIRKEFGIGPKETVVAITSRFNQAKGHEIFLRAAKTILETPAIKNKPRFLIVGDAVFSADRWRAAFLKDMARTLGISDRVIFTGFRGDMPDIYAGIDILVLATDAEACGRVILEAMACAKPVVATRSGGSPELIGDGVTGLLFEPGNQGDLAGKLEGLINDAEGAKKMGASGRKLVEEKFSIQKNVVSIENIYLELMGQGRAHGA